MTTASGSVTAPARTLVSLMWLASPALPVGGFSYSEGLEAAVNAGLVHDESTTARWLAEHLHLVLARSELPVLAHAIKAWEQGDLAAVRACNDWMLHTRESREFRLQTEQMGRSLAQWMVQLNSHQAGADGESLDHGSIDAGPPAAGSSPAAPACLEQGQQLQKLQGGPTWPVAFALACSHAGATAEQALLAFAFSWAENQTQAAIKCVPLGQAAGQRVLATLAQAMESAVQQALVCNEGQAFAPGLAILSARHEEQYSRLFRS